ATMESRAAVTPATPHYAGGVTAKTLPIKACTPVTPVTPENDCTASEAANVYADNAGTACRRWRVHFPNLDPMEVMFAPEATQAEVAAIYPAAMIEPLLERSEE